MRIDSLRTYQIRNLENSSVNFSPGLNYIIGNNGQGKTNIIECLSVLSILRSFRTARLREIISWGQKEASLFANIYQTFGDKEIGCVLKDGTRELFVNDNLVSRARDFIGNLRSVAFTPYDMMTIRGGPSERRSFLNRILIQKEPIYFEIFQKFQTALRSKNLLLKENRPDIDKLKTWNEVLVEPSYQIVKARLDLIEELQIRSNKVHKEFAYQDGEISLALKTNLREKKDDRINMDSVRALFDQSLAKEIEMHRSIVGPQRDDLKILFEGKQFRAYGSQGQTRSILLTLLFSVIEMLEQRYNESPVILLDDVESELDDARAVLFLEMVLGGGRQVFITGTHNRHVQGASGGEEAQFLKVDNGKITPMTPINRSL